MGILVARAERRLVSYLVTGTQFLGREYNSHYHLHMACLKLAKPIIYLYSSSYRHNFCDFDHCGHGSKDKTVLLAIYIILCTLYAIVIFDT